MSRTLRAGVSCCALALAGLSAPVFAQSVVQNTVRATVDANGVDLSTGTLEQAYASVSAGGAHGIAWQQGRGDLSNAGLFEDQNSNHIVVIGNLRNVFVQSGSTFTPQEGDGATLTLSGSTYTYTSAAGDTATFTVVSNATYPHAPEAYISSFTPASGDPLYFSYQPVWVPNPSVPTAPKIEFFRLVSIGQSAYALYFYYQSDTANSYYSVITGGAWSTISRIAAVPHSNSCTPATGSAGCGSYPHVDFATVSGGSTITDALGRVTTISGASATPTGVRFPGSSANDITIGYTNNQVTSVTAEGVATSYGYADSGTTRTTTVTTGSLPSRVYTFYIPTLQILSERWQASSGGPTLTRTYSYNALRQLTQVTEPEGNYTAFTYDARGNVTQTRMVAKTPGTPADIVTSAIYPATCTNPVTCNSPTSVTDARGNSTSYTWDATHGGMLTATGPAVNGISPQTRTSYSQLDANGQASTSGTWMPTGVSTCRTTPSCTGTADETRTTIVYGTGLDATSVTRAAGDGSLSTTTSATYDAIGNLVTRTDPLGHVTRYLYDADREAIGVIGPDPDGAGAGTLMNRATRITYNASGLVSLVEQGNTASQSDADWTSFTPVQRIATLYDANRRKVQDSVQATPLHVTPSFTTYSVAQYSYDAIGRPDCTAMRMNPSTFSALPASACTQGTAGSFGPDRISRTTYDAIGEVLKVTEGYGTPLQRDTATLSWSANGRLKTLADARSNLTSYVYDGFDRLSQTQYPSPTSAGTSNASDYEQLGYDAGSNVTSRRLRDGTSIGYGYDALGRLNSKTLPNGEHAVAYAYDNLGHPTTITGATTLSYGWDALGRMTAETQPYGSLAYQYDAGGRRTRLTWQDGLYLTYGYDNADEMTRIAENGTTTLATYSYDDLGRRTRFGPSDGESLNYGYDAASRLTSLNSQGASAYIALSLSNYSPTGEIGSRQDSSGSFSWTGGVNTNRAYSVNGLNQYTQSGSVALGYDAKGNLTSSGSTTYAYTAENRLKSVSGGVTLAYDPLGRLQDYDTPTVTRFVYDGGMISEEISSTGAILRRYVTGPDGEPAVWYEGSGTGTKRYLYPDERGSVIKIVNQDDSVYALDTYDEYGIPGAANQGRFQYTGQAWLPEIGLQYSRARIYSPTLGRFLQTDPTGYADGPNWYNYAGSNPVNFTDPSGLALYTGAYVCPHNYAQLVPGSCYRPATAYVDGQYNPYAYTYAGPATVDCGGRGIPAGGQMCDDTLPSSATNPTGQQGGGYLATGNTTPASAQQKTPLGCQRHYSPNDMASANAIAIATTGQSPNVSPLSSEFSKLDALPNLSSGAGWRPAYTPHASGGGFEHDLPGGSGMVVKVYIGDTDNGGANTVTITSPTWSLTHIKEQFDYYTGQNINETHAKKFITGVGGC